MPVKQGSGIRKSGRVFGQGQKAVKTIRAGLYAGVSTIDQQTQPLPIRPWWSAPFVKVRLSRITEGTLCEKDSQELLAARKGRYSPPPFG
jgi:hypothetical protein